MCSADGNPNPVIRWYKDGVALEGPQSVGGVYTIDRIKPEDRGTYHCEASNTSWDSNICISKSPD